MALTNEQKAKIVTAGGLAHYHEKSGALFATKTAVSGKADKVSSATNNNLAGLNSNGNLKDSGIAAADVMTKTINTTWSALKALRDGSQLTPGQWYRITDYTCTTTQTDTQSAGHQFDIIVRADDVNVLNENAFAAHHAGDTYFANSKLEAWKLLYCLDNDTDRFGWADSTNGKGVIYRMVDEWNNDVPYDFKNIQFKWTYAITQSSIVANVFYYTFSVATGTNDATVTDHSLNGTYCYSNKIGLYISSNKLKLNSNVFRDTSSTSSCYNNTFGNGCYSNTLGNSCYSNTFGNGCYRNTFGNSCNRNRFGNDCSSNTFGDRCYNNRFGNRCYNNTFGNSCNYNTFGNNCNYNTFGNSCESNTFGNGCYSNTFESSCKYNTLGNGCESNTFGNGCENNTFGNSCSSNTFGNKCSSNTFENSCCYIKLGTSSAAKSYCYYIIVENGNKYLYLDCSATTSYSAYFQNVKIAQGVNNTETYKTITHATAGDTFQTVYQPANSRVISV